MLSWEPTEFWGSWQAAPPAPASSQPCSHICPRDRWACLVPRSQGPGYLGCCKVLTTHGLLHLDFISGCLGPSAALTQALPLANCLHPATRPLELTICHPPTAHLHKPSLDVPHAFLLRLGGSPAWLHIRITGSFQKLLLPGYHAWESVSWLGSGWSRVDLIRRLPMWPSGVKAAFLHAHAATGPGGQQRTSCSSRSSPLF